jgi:glutathione synthase/RimK-type ligase-like ATP-grasp enzyme
MKMDFHRKIPPSLPLFFQYYHHLSIPAIWQQKMASLFFSPHNTCLHIINQLFQWKGIIMGLTKVQIQILPERQFPSNINIMMNRSLVRKLQIAADSFQVTFGSATDIAYISLTKANNNLIRMSARLAAHLKIMSQPIINAHFDPQAQHLYFGPLLGILIDVNHDDGKITKFLEECASSGETSGIQVAIFTPEQIHLDDKMTQAFIRERGEWQNAYLPLPDAIYNRITSRKVEQQEEVQKKLAELRSIHGIPIFNEKFLDKYEVHRILSKDGEIRTLLPETYPFQSGRVKEMLHKYPMIYLKPNNGSLGTGIMRVLRNDGSWICQSSSATGTVTRTTKTWVQMTTLLEKQIKQQPYLVQQGLQLVKVKGDRPVDFRVLVQRNKVGRWQITSAVARVANSQQIVSNVAHGGTIRKCADLLVELGPIFNKPTVSDLRQQALKIANTFERLEKGHFAELGIDLAIDTNGKIWLIEINSKPSKTNNTVTNRTLTTRPSVTRMLEYVNYLANLKRQRKRSAPTFRSYLSQQERRKSR